MELERNIEAVLFYKAEPVKKTELAKLFSVSSEEVESTLKALDASLTGRGIQLVLTDTEAELVVSSTVSEIIKQLRKDELSADIGKAGAEALAIILYKGPLTRAEIDHIRGVNSTFILRNLLIRGLVERRSHHSDARSFLYAITPSLLNHLGIRNRESMPEFAEMMNALEEFERLEKETHEPDPLVSE
jgi:segregation and condensation protein B